MDTHRIRPTSAVNASVPPHPDRKAVVSRGLGEPRLGLRRSRPSARRFAPAIALLAVTACREAPLAFGPNPTAARQNADEFLFAYAARFTSVSRSPKVSYIRMNLGRGTLIPSRVFADTGIWTARFGDTARVAGYSGSFSSRRYVFAVRTPPDPLAQPADSYHSTRLQRLAPDEYEWTTMADFHVGRMPPAALPAVVAATLRAGEQRGAQGVRAEYPSSFPRTTAALGRFYSLDSLSITRDAAGASTVALAISGSPERLRATHPALADYLKKYLDDMQVAITIADRRGTRWAEMSVRDRQLKLRLRSRDGRLVPLEGPARPLPDSLIMRSAFRMRILLFNIGWRDLITEMTLIRDDADQAWQFRSVREPEWVLPPLTRRFIRAPLRRPFAGQGVNFRIGLRTLPGGSTSLYRRGLLQVHESPIIRFLGRLSGQAMGDFYGRSEMDENSFNGDAFAALRADIADVLSPTR